MRPTPSTQPTVSALLVQWRGGDESALDRLMPLIYDELHQLARRHLRGEAVRRRPLPERLLHERASAGVRDALRPLLVD